MSWVILRVEPAKEQRVVTNLQGIFECYLPLEARSYRWGLHRSRAIKEIPLLPRLVFIHRQFIDGLRDIIGHKYVLGLARDAQGGVFSIPDWELAIFRETVSAWLETARKAYMLKQLPPPKPDIVKSFEDMAKVLNERSGLAKLEEAA